MQMQHDYDRPGRYLPRGTNAAVASKDGKRYGSIATMNRWTGKPHQHLREIARNS